MKKAGSFTGHRTRDIFTRKEIEEGKRNDLRLALMKAIEYLIEKEGVEEFYSGGALEVDQEAFVVVQYLKENKYPHIKNFLAAPYRDQPKKWIETIEKAKFNIENSKNPKDKDYWQFVLKEMERAVKTYGFILEKADKVIYVDEEEGYIPRGMKEDQRGKHSNAKLQIRNVYMLDKTQYLIAVYNGKEEGGTYNCVNSAIKKQKEIYYIRPNESFKREKHNYDI